VAYSVELVGSRRGSSGTDQTTEIELLYHVRGATLMTTAVQQILADAPLAYLDPVNGITLVRDQLYWDPLGREPDGTYPYAMRLVYVDPTRQEERRQLDTGEYKISFDTTGGTAKFVQSYATKTFKMSGDQRDYDCGGAINIVDGNVQGIDVVVPSQKLTISCRQPLAVITDAYCRVLVDMTGTINDDTYFGYEAGELLFLGASGMQAKLSDPQIDYHFLASKNVVETIGTGSTAIPNVAKGGHEYLWTWFYEDIVDSVLVSKSKPLFIKVEQVYPESDFDVLGIS
jgi:hypothetical protein